MGIVAPRTLGSHPHPGSWLHLAIPYPFWHGRRCVYTLGAAACAVARGIRRHGRRAHRCIIRRILRLRWRDVFLAMFRAYIDDSGTDPEQQVAIASMLIMPATRIPALDREW